MLLDEGQGQTKWKRSAVRRRWTVLNPRTIHLWWLWSNSITTWLMKFKGVAVVKSAIFGGFNSKIIRSKYLIALWLLICREQLHVLLVVVGDFGAIILVLAALDPSFLLFLIFRLLAPLCFWFLVLDDVDVLCLFL